MTEETILPNVSKLRICENEHWEQQAEALSKEEVTECTPDGHVEEMSSGMGIPIASKPTKRAESLRECLETATPPETVKENVNIVFIGHVDAGKSTIGGHILYLTGVVDKRTIEKYEREAREANRESWYLSWALDTNPEERTKGITVECGRAQFETNSRRFTILDAPGHKSFVPNMIMGAAQADVAILVISARKGEFETGFEKGGQTREHAILAKTCGIKRLVIVINKMDDCTVQWSKERYDECVEKLKPFVKQCGYNLKTDVEFMPISGFTGINLRDRVSKDVCSWYNGPSLLEYLDNFQGIERNVQGPVRIPISEKYKDMGTIVSGKIESGHICKGQTLVLLPNKVLTEILTIYCGEDAETRTATCGDNVRLRLKNIEEDEVLPGFVLCDTQRSLTPTRSFEAQLIILEHKNILCAGYSAVLHIHHLVEEVIIAELLASVDKKTGQRSKRPPIFAKKGDVIIVLIESQGLMSIESFEECPQLGRFTLRDENKTIAMGKILSVMDEGTASSGSMNSVAGTPLGPSSTLT